jgi:long-chain acyl-CoA synthetase
MALSVSHGAALGLDWVIWVGETDTMEIDDWPNLAAMLFIQAEQDGAKPQFWGKRDGEFHPISRREAADQVSALAAALQSYGLAPGDRVIILSHNAPNWAIADFAIMAAGGVTVPAYTTNTVADHAHILTDSGAAMAIVSDATLAAPFMKAVRVTGALKRIVMVEEEVAEDAGSAVISTWSKALDDGRAGAARIAPSAMAIDRNALACLIYTSGTGGEPKGVMLSHRAILANCAGATDILIELGLKDDVFLSFLPLSHAYEHSAGLMFPVSIGAEIYFSERVDSLTADLVVAKPTIMTAVPRLYEVMRERILTGMRRQSWIHKKLFWMAVNLGRRKYENPGTLNLRERLLDRVVDRLVRDKVRARFGGRLKALVSGGAPLNYDIGVFFTALGLRLLQGYGQTEAAPVIACNRCNSVKLRTVGPALKAVELKIAADGEILVRGPLLMDGYWNLPDLSAEVLRDGWLHTGDIGVIDQDQYLQITDRKKDIIVNTGGDTISPQHVEGVLALEPEIAAAMAIGDRRPHLVAIVVPDAEFIDQWAQDNHVAPDLQALTLNKDFHTAISKAIDRANRGLSVIERVKRFAIAGEAFTIENGMMTPTMKPRRHAITERWSSSIEALY